MCTHPTLRVILSYRKSFMHKNVLKKRIRKCYLNGISVDISAIGCVTALKLGDTYQLSEKSCLFRRFGVFLIRFKTFNEF